MANIREIPLESGWGWGRVSQLFRLIGLLGALSASISCLVWLYSPGFAGPFLFDDVPNLQSLALLNGELTWARVAEYLNTGVAGPVGRPLSLLTFLLDATDWPAEPSSFKYTNVLIHGLNGLLVFWLLLLLTQRAQPSTAKSVVVAGLLAAAWTFSPYHVSTVLYVVQRMAMLAAFFVLLGLVLYVKGRLALENQKTRAGFALILAAYIIGAGLGVLSKENAALFVLLVPLMEWLFFSRDGLSLQGKRALCLIIWGAALLFVLGIAAQWPSFSEQYTLFKDFSVTERLFTQARALGYYLWRYLIPGTEYVGIYGDGFGKSTGLMTPISTFVWVLVHAAVVVVAVRMRRLAPLASFGLLFFYVAHLMESSIVPLELFFEHRNYLPSAFLLAPILMLRHRAVTTSVLVTLVLANGALLGFQVSHWVDPYRFRVLQVERNPSSEWATQELAAWYFNHGAYERALATLRGYSRNKHIPGVDLSIKTILASCYANDERSDDIRNLIRAAETRAEKPGSLVRGIDKLSLAIRDRTCKTTTFHDLMAFLEAFRSRAPEAPKILQAYYGARGILAFHTGYYPSFRDSLISAVRTVPDARYTIDACGDLARYRREDGCACLAAGASAFDGHVAFDRSLTRIISGYGEELSGTYRKMRRMYSCESSASG